jgi:hypothetical protein
MKVANSEVIRNGEQELMDAITGEMDWHGMEVVLREEHNLDIEENVEFSRGDIVVHEGQVAYRLEFQVRAKLSVLVDREGNCLSLRMETPGKDSPGSREISVEAAPEEGQAKAGESPGGDYEQVLVDLSQKRGGDEASI